METKIFIEKIKDCEDEMKILTDQLSFSNGITGKETAPDIETYINHNESGNGVLFTLRTASRMVGYIYFIIGDYAEAKGVRMASMDMAYVEENHRGLGSLMLFSESENYFKKMGIDLIFLHHKSKHDLGEFYNKLGYKPVNIEYVKILKE